MACLKCNAVRATAKCNLWAIIDKRHDRIYAFAKKLGPGFYVKPSDYKDALNLMMVNSPEPNKPFIIFSDKMS